MLTRLQLFPEQASTLAPQTDALLLFLLGITAFFVVLIAGSIIVFMIRYRRRDPNEIPPSVHGSLALEVGWSVIPFIIVMIMFFWGARLYATIARPPDDAINIDVVGKQWMWKVQHMEGRREINELHIPVGKPVKLTMTSEDVIHASSCRRSAPSRTWSRAATRRPGSRPRRSAATTSSAPSTAARSTRA